MCRGRAYEVGQPGPVHPGDHCEVLPGHPLQSSWVKVRDEWIGEQSGEPSQRPGPSIGPRVDDRPEIPVGDQDPGQNDAGDDLPPFGFGNVAGVQGREHRAQDPLVPLDAGLRRVGAP